MNSSSLDLSSTGVVLQATDYQPFGKTITYQVTNQRIKGKKGGYKNKYLFANKQQDDETDLQYFEKRYYDNRIGRFTTEDPVFWEVGTTRRPDNYSISPQNWNSYSYTTNNPINLVDPTGEDTATTLVGGTTTLYVALIGNPAGWVALGATVVVAGSYYVVKEIINNQVGLAPLTTPLPQPTSGAGTTNQPTPVNTNSADAQTVNLDDYIVANASTSVSSGGSPSPSGGGGNNGNKGGKGSDNNVSFKSQINKAVDENLSKNHADAKNRFEGLFNNKGDLGNFMKDQAIKNSSQLKNGMKDIRVTINNQIVTVRVNVKGGSIQSINAYRGASSRTGINVINSK